jgi:hypothetical protein
MVWNRKIFDKLLEARRNQLEDLVILDLVGVNYQPGCFPILPKPGSDRGLPEWVGDGFRAGPTEWAALFFAFELGQQAPSYTIVELGASQGLWSAAFVKYGLHLKKAPLFAFGVEASEAVNETLDFWENQNFEFQVIEKNRNLVIQGDSFTFNWINGAVVTKKGPVKFPRINITSDNGASTEPETHTGSRSNLVDVLGITPKDVLSLVASSTEGSLINLLHIDIQGSELELINSSEGKELLQKSNIVMLGTHSIEADRVAISVMAKLGFQLIAIDASKYNYVPQPVLSVDGEQLWIKEELLENFSAGNWTDESPGLDVLANNFYQQLLRINQLGVER